MRQAVVLEDDRLLTSPKTRSSPLGILRFKPRFSSAKSRTTSHGQSTRSTTARASAQSRTSSALPGRGPSAITKSFGGRASRIRSKTRAVSSGRRKMIRATAVSHQRNRASRLGNG